ncbi:MAG TPA: GIY-YIG nuclease family protein [Anaerolineae bacterium]|nr:GIY-YIG nuclease family protein [Anaerolineae bacterium]HQI86089.1 GIY-YIG nuclease family protein [Anaerolineae bacterium]
MRCAIGALGVWTLPAGLYLYVGSAWGAGGLAARVNRHLRGGAVRRWHIDYVRVWAQPVAVWLAPHEHCECVWARHLVDAQDACVIVPRFGASDCRCPAHLLYFGARSLETIHVPGAHRQVRRQDYLTADYQTTMEET